MDEKIWHLRTRTVKALYLIVGSFTLLLVGLGFFILMGATLLPPSASHEFPLR